MNFDLLNNKIIIIDDNMKDSLLKMINNKLFNIKIITLSELKRNYYFDYDNESIYYVSSKYNVIGDIAKKYINNLYYIDDIDDKKIAFLKEIKEDLLNHNLLYKNDLFCNFLKNKDVILFNLKYIDKFYLKILNNLNCNIEYFDIYNNNSIKTIYECYDMEEEISYVCTLICDLIKSGVNINNIKLSNVNNDYYYVIKKYFDMFNIPINLNNNESINGTYLVKIFKDNYSSDIKKTLNMVYDCVNSESDLYIYKQLINIVNSYSFISDYLLVKELIFSDINNVKMNSISYDNAVNIIDIFSEYISDNDYVFLINYNEGVIPINHKDEDYLSDKLKIKLSISTSYELNEIEVLNIREKINKINNLVITYSTHDLNGELYISSSYDSNILKKENIKMNYNNSNIFNLNKYIESMDIYNKYGTIKDELKLLNSNYGSVKYLSYDNNFSGLDKSKIRSFYNNGLTLSYTSLNKYNECAFKYYLKYILSLDKYEDSFKAIVGNITHKVLSLCFNDDFNFDDVFNNEINQCKYSFSDSELYFINKIKITLQKSIEIIKKQLNYTLLNKFMYEKEIIINVNEELNIKFRGYVDKIMYDNVNGNIVVAIIDYKTGNDEINIDDSIYGINMQLPIYMYLIKNSNIFSNVIIGGIYLQKIYENKNDDDLEDSLKLRGYTNSDKNIVSIIDKDYENSKIIKSLKINNDGSFYRYAKLFNDDNVLYLNDLVKNKIIECYSNIYEARFDINPKIISNINYGCRYCKFKDICYVNEKNKVKLPHKTDILGGDN